MVVSSRYVELQLRMPTVRIQFVFLQQTLVYCGQMVGQIKMKLGMEVGLGPGHVVLDGDPAAASPLKKGHTSQFLAYVCYYFIIIIIIIIIS